SEHRIVARDVRLALHGFERSEVEEELAQLAGVGGVAALADEPIARATAQSRLRVARLGDADLGHLVERALEAGEDQGARDRGLIAAAAARDPGGERDDD